MHLTKELSGYLEDTPWLQEISNVDLIMTKELLPSPRLFSPPVSPIAYRGVGLRLDLNNQYLFPILKGGPAMHSYDTKTNIPAHYPYNLLVAGYQVLFIYIYIYI